MRINHIKLNAIIISFLLLDLMSFPIYAKGLFNNPASVLDTFCENETTRQTLIYIDQSLVSASDSDWFRDIQQKITFIPSENISYRLIDMKNSRVKEIWSTCHPSLTSEALVAERENDNIFSRGIDRKISDAASAFTQYQNQALAFALSDNNQQQKPNYKTSDLPKKSIIEALYNDSSIYRLEGKITRVILFSDMVENSKVAAPSKLGNTEVNYALARAAATRYPVNFNNAEFFVYGVGYTHNDSSLDNSLRSFWEMWLNKANAKLSSFDHQLNIPDTGHTLKANSYRGTIIMTDGVKVAARLRLVFSETGKLTNSWLGVKDFHYPLEGDSICAKNSCQIRAKISFSDKEDMLLNVGDVVLLEGLKSLSGSVGSEDDLQLTSDGSRFSLPLSFTKDQQLLF